MAQWMLVLALVVLGLAVVLLAFCPPPALANTFCVNPEGTGGCYASLQAAVDAASPGDTIQIAAGYYGTVSIDKDGLALIGGDPGTTAFSFDNHATNTVVSRATTSMPNNTGELTLDNVIITGCAYWCARNDAVLTMTNSAIVNTNNTVRPQFAALSNFGTLYLANVTFSGNTTRPDLWNTGNAKLNHVTMMGGILNDGVITAMNTIFVSFGNCKGTLVSQGHNISQNVMCSPLNGPGDMPGTNPQLTPQVRVNGTWVNALWSTSPAIDAADDSACPSTDQTGFPRPYGFRCDIGAYEWRPMDFSFSFLPFVGR